MCAHSMHLKNALININIIIFFSYFQQLKHFTLPVIYCKLFKKNQFFSFISLFAIILKSKHYRLEETYSKYVLLLKIIKNLI